VHESEGLGGIRWGRRRSFMLLHTLQRRSAIPATIASGARILVMHPPDSLPVALTEDETIGF